MIDETCCEFDWQRRVGPFGDNWAAADVLSAWRSPYTGPSLSLACPWIAWYEDELQSLADSLDEALPPAAGKDPVEGEEEEMAQHYQPEGVRFYDRATRREMLLVVDDSRETDGWLCYKHPDGQWVTLRKATESDRATIEGAP